MSEEKTHRPWLWALSSCVCLAIGVWLLTIFPDVQAKADRYERAVRAGSAEESAAIVTDLRRYERRRNDDFHVDLRLKGGVERSVEVESGADWSTLRRGEEVTVVFWDEQIARIEHARGPAVETTQSPLHDEASSAVFGLLLVPWSAFGLWTAFRLRRRSGSWRRKAQLPRGRLTGRRAMGCGAIMLASLSSVLFLSAAVYDLGVLAVIIVTGAVFGAVIGLLYWAVDRWWRGRRSGDESDEGDESGDEDD